MECKQCGECCRFITLNVPYITEDMRKHINAHRNITVIGNRILIKSKCKYLKKNLCVIYEARPDVCRLSGCIKYSTDWIKIKKWLHSNSR